MKPEYGPKIRSHLVCSSIVKIRGELKIIERIPIFQWALTSCEERNDTRGCYSEKNGHEPWKEKEQNFGFRQELWPKQEAH